MKQLNATQLKSVSGGATKKKPSEWLFGWATKIEAGSTDPKVDRFAEKIAETGAKFKKRGW